MYRKKCRVLHSALLTRSILYQFVNKSHLGDTYPIYLKFTFFLYKNSIKLCNYNLMVKIIIIIICSCILSFNSFIYFFIMILLKRIIYFLFLDIICSHFCIYMTSCPSILYYHGSQLDCITKSCIYKIAIYFF